MTTFVLVPGFWMGGWAWDAVAAGLRSAGHTPHPVTPTGHRPMFSRPDDLAALLAALPTRAAPGPPERTAPSDA